MAKRERDEMIFSGIDGVLWVVRSGHFRDSEESESALYPVELGTRLSAGSSTINSAA